MRGMRFTCGWIFVLGMAATLWAQDGKTPNPAATQTVGPSGTGGGKAVGGESGAAVRTAMRNVDYHLTDRIILHITSLDGKLTVKPGQIPVFDDKNSFGLDVGAGNIILSMTALTNDMNDYVFARADAPLKKLSTSTQGDQLIMKGLLVSKGGIPFETSGTLSVTPEGMIRVHTQKVKALKLPVKGLMDMLGLDTEKLLNTKKVEGVTVDKDDLILDPEKLFPPPELHGRLTSLKIENGEIHLTFGPENGGAAPAPIKESCGGAKNYLHFRGGSVRFGKLTMSDTDLELLDTTPADPFDFSMEHYNKQLVAGYAKSTAARGLCVHMPDYNKIKQKAEAKPAAAPKATGDAKAADAKPAAEATPKN